MGYNLSMDSEIQAIFGAAIQAGTSANPIPMELQSIAVTPGEPSNVGVTAQNEVSIEKIQTKSMTSLAQYVRDQFRNAADYRKRPDASGRSVEDHLRDSIMAQTCAFDAKARSILEAAGVNPKVFSPITAVKIRAAKSMLTSIVTFNGDPMFALDPTPVPDLPEEIGKEATKPIMDEINQLWVELVNNGVQNINPQINEQINQVVEAATEYSITAVENHKEAYARKRAKRLEKKVHDIMVEGGFYKEFKEKYLDYICTYGTCVMVGPVMRNVAKNVNKKTKSGERIIDREIVSIPTYEAINPVDCYPAPNSTDVTDGPLCIRVNYTATELWRFSKSVKIDGDVNLGNEGWRPLAVKKLLADHPYGGVKINWDVRDSLIQQAERKDVDNINDCTFEGIRCFASISGDKLLEMGITKTLANEKIERNGYYNTEVITIDDVVVYVRIYDDRIGMPLSKGVFYSVPGSWWGEAIADKLAHCQTILNNAIKALMQNMGVASGPMYWMKDFSRLSNQTDGGYKPYPHKVWLFQNQFNGIPSQDASAPMGVMTVPSNASELLAVYKQIQTQADIDSGIPAFSEGTGGSNGGALRTAEGLKTFTEATNRGMQMVVSTSDDGVIMPMAKRTADWVLITSKDSSIKGDVTVKPVGLMGRLLKAQSNQERLQMFNMVINSQYMQQLVGVKGVVELFKPSLRALDINADNVCPDPERIEYLEQLEKIKQVFMATNAAQGAAANAEGMSEEPAGAPPGVDQPPTVSGGVTERRAVA